MSYISLAILSLGKRNPRERAIRHFDIPRFHKDFIIDWENKKGNFDHPIGIKGSG